LFVAQPERVGLVLLPFSWWPLSVINQSAPIFEKLLATLSRGSLCWNEMNYYDISSRLIHLILLHDEARLFQNSSSFGTWWIWSTRGTKQILWKKTALDGFCWNDVRRKEKSVDGEALQTLTTCVDSEHEEKQMCSMASCEYTLKTSPYWTLVETMLLVWSAWELWRLSYRGQLSKAPLDSWGWIGKSLARAYRIVPSSSELRASHCYPRLDLLSIFLVWNWIGLLV
jgi:hypothetical protein